MEMPYGRSAYLDPQPSNLASGQIQHRNSTTGSTPLSEDLVRLHYPLRQAMMYFFQRRRLPDPDELADEVFVRVLQKIQNGLQLHCPIEQYCWRVARFVCFEQFRRKKTEELTENLPLGEHTPFGLLPAEASTLYRECLDLLSAAEIEFIQKYLHEDKQLLALELKTNAGAMATRFCKLKKRLEGSVHRHSR